jgi:hypothetical protein
MLQPQSVIFNMSSPSCFHLRVDVVPAATARVKPADDRCCEPCYNFRSRCWPLDLSMGDCCRFVPLSTSRFCCRFASPDVPQLPVVLIIFSRSASKIHRRCLIVSLSVRIIQHFLLLSIRNYLNLIYSIVTHCFCNSMPTNQASLLLMQCAYLIEAPTDCSMHALQRCVGRRFRSCASAAFCMSPVHIAISRPSRGANMVVAVKKSSSPTYCMNEE